MPETKKVTKLEEKIEKQSSEISELKYSQVDMQGEMKLIKSDISNIAATLKEIKDSLIKLVEVSGRVDMNAREILSNRKRIRTNEKDIRNNRSQILKWSGVFSTVGFLLGFLIPKILDLI